MSKLSGNPFVSHGRIQDTMTYDILAIGYWRKVGGQSPPPFYFSLRTGSLEEDSGGRRRREGEGGEGGVDPGIGCPFTGSWMGTKLRSDIRDPELG